MAVSKERQRKVLERLVFQLDPRGGLVPLPRRALAVSAKSIVVAKKESLCVHDGASPVANTRKARGFGVEL